VEANAFQRILKRVIEREMELRNKYIPVVPVLAQGDKKARIRTALGMRLAREKIWMVRGADREFREELKVFPMSENKLDVLDESEKAFAYLQRPTSPEEDEKYEEIEREVSAGMVNVGAMGY
jgi:hypothetical protein